MLRLKVLIVSMTMVALSIAVLGHAFAASPTQNVVCTTCHTDEASAWENSPHASANVTCEACHGPAKEGHPGEAKMVLGVEASTCRDCHSETYEHWLNSLHAKKGVQCISCHLSHSQEFRLTDEALCGSCHRDVMADFIHSTADVTCVTCHVSATVTGDTSSSVTIAKGHEFTATSNACVVCHGSEVHHLMPDESANIAIAESEAQLTQLVVKQNELQATNRSLRTLAVVNLGIGLGVGGMVGIVFMMIVNAVFSRGSSKE